MRRWGYITIDGTARKIHKRRPGPAAVLRATTAGLRARQIWLPLLPRAAALYAHAASELNEPRLLEGLRDGRPVYAWPYDAGHGLPQGRRGRFAS